MFIKVRKGYEIAGYILDELAGAGGFSSVYKARSVSALPLYDNIVAVKVLHPRRLDRRQIRRFVREAKISMTLSHPNIVKVYEIRRQDRNFFIIMEYLDADLMKAIKLNNGIFTPENIVRIIKRAGTGLEYVHKNGIIHKDVNPANILINFNLEKIKFTDFGLAWQRRVFIKEGEVMAGTEGYLAPERLKGAPSNIQTDIYAFGKTMEKIYRELGFAIPEDIIRVIKRATHPEIEERFKDMQSLLNHLP